MSAFQILDSDRFVVFIEQDTGDERPGFDDQMVGKLLLNAFNIFARPVAPALSGGARRKNQTVGIFLDRAPIVRIKMRLDIGQRRSVADKGFFGGF